MLGVSRVIFPEREMAIRIAHSLVMPNLIDYIELSRDFSIVEVPAPDAFVGRTLKQLELRPRLGLTLIAVKRQADGGAGVITYIAPSADETIRSGDGCTGTFRDRVPSAQNPGRPEAIALEHGGRGKRNERVHEREFVAKFPDPCKALCVDIARGKFDVPEHIRTVRARRGKSSATMSDNPRGSAIAAAKNEACWMAANDTKTTRAEPSSAIPGASSTARRVLPAPPGPVSVMRRLTGSANHWRSVSRSPSRPSSAVRGTGSETLTLTNVENQDALWSKRAREGHEHRSACVFIHEVIDYAAAENAVVPRQRKREQISDAE
jgi:hypothetical protein